MATLLKTVIYHYDNVFKTYADPRTENFFLAQSPLIPIAIAYLYLMFVNKWGPRFMKDRPAFNVDRILVIYNILQIILSARTFYLGCKHLYIFGRYKLQCEPIDYTNSPLALFVASETHNYYLVKILDLMDTVFFVLRKRQRQVTFLHLYHHVGMLAASWIGVRFAPGGHAIFMGFLNSFVHMMMYLYYLIAINSSSSNIWWKKYITILQITQFCLIGIHWAALIFGPSCGFPKIFGYLLFPNNLLMLYMFAEFYYKSYIKKSV